MKNIKGDMTCGSTLLNNFAMISYVIGDDVP